MVDDGKPESWATAEIHAFLQLDASYLTWRIETVVLDDFRSRPGSPADPRAFDGLYQPEIALPGLSATGLRP